MSALTLQQIAKALGGEIHNDEVLAPGPDHSATDRSLSVKLSKDDPDNFVVHSFANDAISLCRDHVSERLGRPPYEPNGGRKDSNHEIAKTTYEYRDPATGNCRYRKTRREYPGGTKKFFFDQKGRGGSPALLYGGERLANLREGQTVWIVEGEKKVERLRELGAVAVSGDAGAQSRWLPEHAKLLSGLSVILWPDSDEPGETYIAHAAAAIRATDHGADIRVVRPFGPPNSAKGKSAKGKDVCDWQGDAQTLAELAASAQPYEQIQEQARALFSHIINPVDWEGVPVPERKWTVHAYIPHATVTLLTGDGGQGKSLLALQLAAARALARDWMGLLPEPGRTLVLSAEDDGDEMQRRLDGIRKFYNAEWTDFADIRLIDLVSENSVLGAPMKGQIEPTETYRRLDAHMASFKPSLTVLDVLADMFAGQENDRAQVRQFIRLLTQLARKHDCAVLLLAHPSIAGMNTGTGLSGSTDWNNGVRSRLYFQTPKTEDGATPNKNLRTLEGMKANYSERGGKIDLEWKNGLFVRIDGPIEFDKLAAEKKAEEIFLATLKHRNSQFRNVSDKPGSNYAPAVFTKEPETTAARVNRKQLEGAMVRLFSAGKIRVEVKGPPSRQTRAIVIADGNDG